MCFLSFFFAQYSILSRLLDIDLDKTFPDLTFDSTCIELFSRTKRSYMSPVTRKQDFCICDNKDADQLRGSYVSADQHFRFR